MPCRSRRTRSLEICGGTVGVYCGALLNIKLPRQLELTLWQERTPKPIRQGGCRRRSAWRAYQGVGAADLLRELTIVRHIHDAQADGEQVRAAGILIVRRPGHFSDGAWS